MDDDQNAPPPSVMTSQQNKTTLTSILTTQHSQNRTTNVAETPPPTSLGTPTTNNEEIHPTNNVGEALESKTMKIICMLLKSLLMALQHRTIEWTEEFIDTREIVERKVSSTRNLQHSTVHPKSTTLNFEIGASEKAKEVHK